MRRAGTIRRVLPAALATALAACPAAAVAAGAGRHGTDRAYAPHPRQQLEEARAYAARMAVCRRSPRIEARVAVIGAWMRPLPGARRLALRVDLYQRPLAGGRWTLRADVPGLSRWTTPSDPLLGASLNDVYRYRQAVGQLAVPFAYRFRVAFRWSDASGAVVREEQLTTASCREPDLRPDLVLGPVRVEPVGASGTTVYRVPVRNVGRAPATGVEVSTTLAGSVRTVRRLAPGAALELSFVGPACRTGQVGPSFVVDPANAIDEAREANNARVAACAQQAGAGGERSRLH